jgi:hypothetical protein
MFIYIWWFVHVSNLFSVVCFVFVLSVFGFLDITPPHAGVVHDGLPGNPEIDYQQGYVLNVYWDQFFDRESGVYFYQYIVGPSCENKHSFDLDLTTNPNVSKKLKTFNIIISSDDKKILSTDI